MKQIILLITCITFFSFTTKAQVYPFTDGFETYTPLLSSAGLLSAGYQTDSFKLYNNTHAYVSTQCATLRLTTTYTNDSLVSPSIGPITGASRLSFYTRSCNAFGPYPRQHRLRTGEYMDVIAVNTSTGINTTILHIDSTNQNPGNNYLSYSSLVGAFAGDNIRLKFNVVGNSSYFLDIDSITLMDTVAIIPPAFDLNPVITSPLCPGGADGSIHLYPSGGTSPYTYLWHDSLGSTYDSLTGLTPGNYIVTVTDSTGDTVRQTITVTNAATAMNATITRTSPLCVGDSNGTATAHVTLGTAPYSYLWSTGATDSIATNLSDTTYTVTITDNHGCTITRSVTILPARAMTIRFTTIDESAIGAADGSSQVRVLFGGTPGFSYLWGSGGATTSATNTGLTAGVYCVTVTDTNGCTATGCDTINVALPLQIGEIFHIDATCYGDTSGAVRLRGLNGTNPYTFDWSDGFTGALHTGLTAGVYTITITDGTGRTGVDSVIITSPPAITGTISVTPTSSSTASTGTASVVAGGGIAPYTYLWSPTGETTADIANLSFGVYTVLITDSNGCTNSFDATIVISGISSNDIGKEVSIYPTPAGNTLFIDVKNTNFNQFTLSDVNGKILLVKSKDNACTIQTIDLNGLSAGQYFLQIADKSGNQFTRKIIKQ